MRSRRSPRRRLAEADRSSFPLPGERGLAGERCLLCERACRLPAESGCSALAALDTVGAASASMDTGSFAGNFAEAVAAVAAVVCATHDGVGRLVRDGDTVTAAHAAAVVRVA